MPPITCPVCRIAGEPAVQLETLAICSARGCGASLHLDRGQVRRATASETAALSPEALRALRAAHGKIARPGR